MNYERINWTTGTKVKEGYTIINGQEYQTVQPEYYGETPINVENLNHMDEQLENVSVDYITEIDHDNTWSWRKWKSGRIELIGSKSYSGLNITTQSMGTWYGANGTLALPFALNSVEFINSQEGSRSSGVYVYLTSISGTTLTTQFRAHASSSNAGCDVKYYIIGTYETE